MNDPTMVQLAVQPFLAASDALVYALPVVGSMLLFFGVYQVVVESRTTSSKRMQERLRGERHDSESKAASLLRRTTMNQPKSLIVAAISKLKFIPRLQTALRQADLDWSASQMMVNLGGIALVVAAGMFVLHISVFVALGCAGAVMILPIVYVSFRRQRRLTKLANQLPDVFEMMSQALRAGHSLAGAIQVIYEQMPAPVATEFAQVYHEQNLGIKVEDALQSMADRVESLDVRFFVTAVLIQRQTGGDLAEVLDNIGGVIRQRIELQGLVRGLTAEGRLSGWVLFALPGVVFAGSMVMNPDYANTLLEDPRGKIMLMVAVGMQLMGIAMIRWIVNIKV